MRRTIIVIPDLLGATLDDSPLLQKLDTLRTMSELGELKRLTKIPQVETQEALWLGLKPDEGQLKQGPLTVSALGADPPDRSTHFHVSLLGLTEGTIQAVPPKVRDEDLRAVLDQAKKLNTKSLTLLEGENTDHALVWEGIGDLATRSPNEVTGKQIKPNLPEGDADRELRRFIDDSVNLLNELQMNERRVDEGLPPLNLLWPWGDGRRKPVPNLLLKRGERAHVESGSLRLAGLTRLVGYKHGDRHAFGHGVNTRLDSLATIAIKQEAPVITVIDGYNELRDHKKQEEMHWLAREIDHRLLKPLFEHALKNPGRVSLIATGAEGGLALRFQTHMSNSNPYPFDERSLEEKSVIRTDAWTSIDYLFGPESSIE
jgi:2,3-bisphosphoglycerate-independent phosphoglycerate mutase